MSEPLCANCGRYSWKHYADGGCAKFEPMPYPIRTAPYEIGPKPMTEPKITKQNRAYAENLPPGRHQVILASVHLARCAFYFRRGILWGVVLASIPWALAFLAARGHR